MTHSDSYFWSFDFAISYNSANDVVPILFGIEFGCGLVDGLAESTSVN